MRAFSWHLVLNRAATNPCTSRRAMSPGQLRRRGRVEGARSACPSGKHRQDAVIVGFKGFTPTRQRSNWRHATGGRARRSTDLHSREPFKRERGKERSQHQPDNRLVAAT